MGEFAGNERKDFASMVSEPKGYLPRWGNVYEWTQGKLKDAVHFLMAEKSGFLTNVFHRSEIGNISLGWGEAQNDWTGRGLAHIIRKHIDKLGDFDNIDDLCVKMSDVVNHGTIREDGNNTYAIEKDGYRVVVVKDNDGNWILSAFDYVHSKKEKLKRKDAATRGTPGQPNVEAGAVTSNLSNGKVTSNRLSEQCFDEENDLLLRDGDSADYDKAVARDISQMYDCYILQIRCNLKPKYQPIVLLPISA